MSGAALASGLPRVPGQVLRKTPVSQRLAGISNVGLSSRQVVSCIGNSEHASAHSAQTHSCRNSQLKQLFLGRITSCTVPRLRSSTYWAAACSLTTAVAVMSVLLLLLPQPAAALSLEQVLGGVESFIADSGTLGPLVFVAAYVLATVLLVPASLLTLAAGALFGPLLGTAVVSMASTLGASAAFLIGRYLARPAVEKRISSNRKFAAVDGAIAAKGARIVLLLRLSPLFPFTLLNYGLSLTKVQFWPYVLSSWVGMLPGTFAYVALGGAGRAAAESASGSGMDPVRLGLYIVGAVATLWVTKIISQTASKALQEASADSAAEGEGEDEASPLNR